MEAVPPHPVTAPASGTVKRLITGKKSISSGSAASATAPPADPLDARNGSGQRGHRFLRASLLSFMWLLLFDCPGAVRLLQLQNSVPAEGRGAPPGKTIARVR
jgi:hypothetical protein